MLRLPASLAATLALAALPFALPATAFADDPAPTPEPGMDTPTEKPKKKVDFDDVNIYADWKFCKGHGARHCRERADYWTKKGVVGKDVIWLGKMWARGEDYPKAVAALEQFMDYKVPAGAPEKDTTNNTQNRQVARHDLIDAYFKNRDWAKSVDACEKFRAEWPDNPVSPETWDDQGRAVRMLGDDAKAVECFEKGADKQFRAFADIVDVYLCNGDPEKAQATITKYAAAFEKQASNVNWLKDVVATIGSPAPALDVAVPVSGEPAKAYDKITVLFHYGSIQSGGVDVKLAKIEKVRKENADKVNAIGIATYKHYNAETRKVEQDLSPDQEAAGVRKFWEQATDRVTPCAMVPQAFLDSLKIKWENQITVVDATGRLRYARFNEEKPYDLEALQKVIEKLAATPPAK